MEPFIEATILGVGLGTLSRLLMLRNDYRQYPSYPHGVVTHISLGFIAAVLGALAIPALMEEEFTAVTFLSLAATQFREVRAMERTMLGALERSELVPRGSDYIEGISRVFESRNYLVMGNALVVSGVTYFTNYIAGLAVSIPVILISRMLMRGKKIGDIAKVRTGPIRFEGPNLYVEDIHFMNLGSIQARQTVLERGVGVVIEPFDDNARAILANTGQRQAIAHDAAALMGIYRDVDTAEFTPLVRRDLDTGRIGLVILPIERDKGCLLEAVRGVPVLESAAQRPLETHVGKIASD